jgi:hypothetical protein
MPPKIERLKDAEVMKLFKRIKSGKMIDNDGLLLIKYLEQLDAENCFNLKTCAPVENEYYKGCAVIVDKLLENFAKCTERKKKPSPDAHKAFD